MTGASGDHTLSGRDRDCTAIVAARIDSPSTMIVISP